jgi:hypothetical protein
MEPLEKNINNQTKNSLLLTPELKERIANELPKLNDESKKKLSELLNKESETLASITKNSIKEKGLLTSEKIDEFEKKIKRSISEKKEIAQKEQEEQQMKGLLSQIDATESPKQA